MKLFRLLKFQQKLDSVKIFLSVLVSELYRDNPKLSNGYFLLFFNKIIPNKRLSKQLLYNLENNNKIVLCFTFRDYGKYCSLVNKLFNLDKEGWEKLNIEGVKGDWNGLCILYKNKKGELLNYKFYKEHDLKNSIFKQIKYTMANAVDF